jgi:hypothetical protein
MVTAIQSDEDAKVIHFPEVMTIRIRDSWLESQVKFTIKELDVWGSKTLCTLYLKATDIIDWMDDEDCLRRFQMAVYDNTWEVATDPWICVQFDEASDVRELGALNSLDTGKQNLIRTVDPRMDGHIETATPAEFKTRHQLLDRFGNPMEEPPEDELAVIAKYRRRVYCCIGCASLFLFLSIIGYVFFRFYIWSCYRQFEWITEAQLMPAGTDTPIPSPVKFPITQNKLHKVADECEQKADVMPATSIGKHYCLPSTQQIMQVCKTRPQDPFAFKDLMETWFGWDVNGVSCFQGICKFRNDLKEWDVLIGIGCLVAVLMIWGMHELGGHWVRQKKIQMAKGHKKQLPPEMTGGQYAQIPQKY